MALRTAKAKFSANKYLRPGLTEDEIEEIKAQISAGSWVDHDYRDDLWPHFEDAQNHYLYEEDLQAFQQPLHDFAPASYYI